MQRDNLGAVVEVAAETTAGICTGRGAHHGTVARMPWGHAATLSLGMGWAGMQRVCAQRLPEARQSCRG